MHTGECDGISTSSWPCSQPDSQECSRVTVSANREVLENTGLNEQKLMLILRYDHIVEVLNPTSFGAPCSRRRFYIMLIRKDVQRANVGDHGEFISRILQRMQCESCVTWCICCTKAYWTNPTRLNLWAQYVDLRLDLLLPNTHPVVEADRIYRCNLRQKAAAKAKTLVWTTCLSLKDVLMRPEESEPECLLDWPPQGTGKRQQGSLLRFIAFLPKNMFAMHLGRSIWRKLMACSKPSIPPLQAWYPHPERCRCTRSLLLWVDE